MFSLLGTHYNLVWISGKPCLQKAASRKAAPGQMSLFEWHEEQHPRSEDGKFASKGGAGKSSGAHSQLNESLVDYASNLSDGDKNRLFETFKEYGRTGVGEEIFEVIADEPKFPIAASLVLPHVDWDAVENYYQYRLTDDTDGPADVLDVSEDDAATWAVLDFVSELDTGKVPEGGIKSYVEKQSKRRSGDLVESLTSIIPDIVDTQGLGEAIASTLGFPESQEGNSEKPKSSASEFFTPEEVKKIGENINKKIDEDVERETKRLLETMSDDEILALKDYGHNMPLAAILAIGKAQMAVMARRTK